MIGLPGSGSAGERRAGLRAGRAFSGVEKDLPAFDMAEGLQRLQPGQEVRIIGNLSAIHRKPIGNVRSGKEPYLKELDVVPRGRRIRRPLHRSRPGDGR